MEADNKKPIRAQFMIIMLAGAALFALAMPAQSGVPGLEVETDPPLPGNVGATDLDTLIEEIYLKEFGTDLSTADNGTSISLDSQRVAYDPDPLSLEVKYSAQLAVSSPGTEPVVVELPEPTAATVWLAQDQSYRASMAIGTCPPPEGPEYYQTSECHVDNGPGGELEMTVVWEIDLWEGTIRCEYSSAYSVPTNA